jgi:hypothetical protein
MLVRSLCLLVGMLFVSPAIADEASEEAPRFLLGDLGVQIHMNEARWSNIMWSDWDFSADRKGDAHLKLYAWSHPYAQPLERRDLDAWGKLFIDKVTKLGGSNAAVTDRALDTSGKEAVATYTVSFGKGGSGRMYGALVSIEEYMFPIATVATSYGSRNAAKRHLDALVKNLEVRTPYRGIPSKVEVSGKGIETTLPDGWREPYTHEMDRLTKRTRSLGVGDLDGCWMALKPRPMEDPDLIVNCQGGMWLGVVDSDSFVERDTELRERLFRKVVVPPAKEIALNDRVGFLYEPPLSKQSLVVSVVPYADGISRTWAMGVKEAAPDLKKATLFAMSHTTYSGPHPVSMGDRISYYLSYHPFSLVVLGPITLFGAFFGGLIMMFRRGSKKNPFDVDEDEEAYAF